jgi:FkbM family methyltransferase
MRSTLPAGSHSEWLRGGMVAVVPRSPGLIWVLGLVAGDVMVDGSIRGQRFRPLGLWWTAPVGGVAALSHRAACPFVHTWSGVPCRARHPLVESCTTTTSGEMRAMPRRRRQPQVLPNGLRVHGATPGDARSQHFIESYFEGGLDLRRGMTVFDVGANIGLFSLEVLRRTGGDLELYCFEPARETFEHLKRNVEELFPEAPVRLFRVALANRHGTATLYHRPRLSVTSSLYREAGGDPGSLVRGMVCEPPDRYRNLFPYWLRRLPPQQRAWILRALARWSQAEVVETPCAVTTVSAVVKEHGIDRIDFLKVDVEGAELEVLRGIRPEDWAKIDRLAVEVHDVDGRVQAMRAILRSAGFTEIHVDQEWPFQGTDIYMLHAARTAAGAEPVAALTATDERDASRRNDEGEENHA